MPTVNAEKLERLTAAIFQRVGATPDGAQTVASHLVESNLTGHDSHGVLRIAQYIDLIDSGALKPAAAARVVRETPAIAVIDGGGGFGQVVARDAMRLAMAKARALGIGAATVRSCSHTGRIGTYTCMAAREGLVGIAVVNSGGGGQNVAPFGGTERRLSTNPISIAAPGPGGEPIMFDAASSVAPEGKVRNLHQAGKKTPDGWMIDHQGRPTNDTGDFYNDPGGALLPLGYTVGHKGYALAFVIDILAGALSGGGCCQSVPPPPADGMLAIALDVSQFVAPEEFDAQVATLVRHVKSSKLAPGVAAIRTPGEPEAINRARLAREGIFIEPAVWRQIDAICQRLSLDTAIEV
jgi:uncharacterized oxidoreductase